jgi:hypothetical protein
MFLCHAYITTSQFAPDNYYTVEFSYNIDLWIFVVLGEILYENMCPPFIFFIFLDRKYFIFYFLYGWMLYENGCMFRRWIYLWICPFISREHSIYFIQSYFYWKLTHHNPTHVPPRLHPQPPDHQWNNLPNDPTHAWFWWAVGNHPNPPWKSSPMEWKLGLPNEASKARLPVAYLWKWLSEEQCLL